MGSFGLDKKYCEVFEYLVGAIPEVGLGVEMGMSIFVTCGNWGCDGMMHKSDASTVFLV